MFIEAAEPQNDLRGTSKPKPDVYAEPFVLLTPRGPATSNGAEDRSICAGIQHSILVFSCIVFHCLLRHSRSGNDQNDLPASPGIKAPGSRGAAPTA
jgi:hypothetical protein